MSEGVSVGMAGGVSGEFFHFQDLKSHKNYKSDGGKSQNVTWMCQGMWQWVCQ